MGNAKKGGKKKLIPIVIVSVILVALVILLVLSLLIIYTPENSQEKLNITQDIESTFISDDLNYLYIKFKDLNLSENLSSAKIKILIKDANDTAYYYETNKTFSEITSDKISIPLKKTLLDVFSNKESVSFDYRISLENVTDKKISYIDLIFDIKKTINASINQTQNKSLTKKKAVTAKDSTAKSTAASTTTPDDENDDCTDGSWENQSFRCNNLERELRQTRILCTSGATEERWVSMPCDSGYRCYNNTDAPLEKCINDSIYCIDNDNGINTTINSFVNVTEELFSDSCSSDNKTLTEYYCGYVNSRFIARNLTMNCTFSCLDGACITCTDNDNDGYSIDEGVCGIADCNDSNSDINPGELEICGNNIDENCDGIIPGCENFGLMAYYKFNNDLSNGIAYDETGYNNASCTACPIYREDLGINNSGTYEFNGNSNYLIIPPSTLNNQTYTISAWINPNVSGNGGMIIYFNAGTITQGILNLWYSRDTNSILIYNNYNLQNQSSMDTIAPNEWSNIILTYNINLRQVKVYINGELKITDNDFIETPLPAVAMIGAKSDNTKYFSGYIDEIKIYNRVLADSEIQSIYNENAGQLPSIGFFERILEFLKKIFS